ncbi:hypothetical protein ACH5RR_008240 [Cinchona calisaya]|uniref:SAM domain-containing protein n=1 Tax=Cinchona calisaya TaxID=153742 RepID=A0ABD3AGV2_9GENT
MDWFSWLSKASLDPSTAYDYALAFAQNELEQDDIVYFNHEFLQSMGISVAKHRLEILKLARKDKTKSQHPMFWLHIAVKQAKSYVAKHICSRVNRDNSSALTIMPKGSYSSRWKAALLKRNRRLIQTSKLNSKPMLITNGQEILMLTNGSPVESISSSSCSSSPDVQDFCNNEKVANNEYWLNNNVEELKWETMFQDLKPT